MALTSRRAPALSATAAILTLCLASPARAAEPADRVLGQLRFDAVTANLVDGRGFDRPSAVAVDRSVTPNRVWVADTGNDRVLGWRDVGRFFRRAPADLVLGRPDPWAGGPAEAIGRCLDPRAPAGADAFCGPLALAVDGAGRVYVADGGNRRVLAFDDPFATDRVADRVYGQPGFDDHGPGIDARALAVGPAGELYVLERRAGVLAYGSPLARAAPDLVLAPDPACAVAFCDAAALAVDAAGDLYVGDRFRSRRQLVWVYRRPLATDAAPDLRVELAASVGLLSGLALDAAGDLWAASITPGGVHLLPAPLGPAAEPATTLSALAPAAVAIDGAGGLLVADLGRHAVLGFDDPLAADAVADRIAGQASFDPLAPPDFVDRRGLSLPMAVAVDASVSPNRLYVLDAGNSRVLGWRDAAAFGNGTPADLVLGQPDPWTAGCNRGGLGPATLCLREETRVAVGGLAAGGLTVDRRGTLWVADVENHRILGFDRPFEADAVADHVLGQRGSFVTRECNRGGLSAASLCHPGALAVDRRGNLYAADLGNHRVLIYRRPLATAAADRVLGQRDRFRSGECNRGGASAASLCLSFVDDSQHETRGFWGMSGLAVDGAGRLWVSDWLNDRVLGFEDPLGTDTVADRVLGQARFSLAGACRELCGPAGLALDPAGGLWVADEDAGRAVWFERPWRDTTAGRVIGWEDLAGGDRPPLGPARLQAPMGLAVDPAGRLFVADTRHHRVLAFDDL